MLKQKDYDQINHKSYEKRMNNNNDFLKHESKIDLLYGMVPVFTVSIGFDTGDTGVELLSSELSPKNPNRKIFIFEKLNWDIDLSIFASSMNKTVITTQYFFT